MAEVIKFAETDDEILACFPVMRELRPNLKEESFLSQVDHLHGHYGFLLAYLAHEEVMSVAGLRIAEWLHQGRYLEIEDLVVRAGSRSQGHGGRLFDWIVDYARSQNCNHLRLVSALTRERAHRFYERKGMQRFAYYFTLDL